LIILIMLGEEYKLTSRLCCKYHLLHNCFRSELQMFQPLELFLAGLVVYMYVCLLTSRLWLSD
jgi:hypothetical protein